MESLVGASNEVTKHTKELTRTLEALHKKEPSKSSNTDASKDDLDNGTATPKASNSSRVDDDDSTNEMAVAADTVASSEQPSPSSAVTDDQLLNLFTNTNISILGAIKTDKNLQSQIAINNGLNGPPESPSHEQASPRPDSSE